MAELMSQAYKNEASMVGRGFDLFMSILRKVNESKVKMNSNGDGSAV